MRMAELSWVPHREGHRGWGGQAPQGEILPPATGHTHTQEHVVQHRGEMQGLFLCCGDVSESDSPGAATDAA